mmetsp:Transcript_11674/g.38368  ORF Transcript_11674/g.38368 Transcript_11674/m.38368 type:complete len:277 (+) Transcript_11674:771-1601(+)
MLVRVLAPAPERVPCRSRFVRRELDDPSLDGGGAWHPARAGPARHVRVGARVFHLDARLVRVAPVRPPLFRGWMRRGRVGRGVARDDRGDVPPERQPLCSLAARVQRHLRSRPSHGSHHKLCLAQKDSRGFHVRGAWDGALPLWLGRRPVRVALAFSPRAFAPLPLRRHARLALLRRRSLHGVRHPSSRARARLGRRFPRARGARRARVLLPARRRAEPDAAPARVGALGCLRLHLRCDAGHHVAARVGHRTRARRQRRSPLIWLLARPIHFLVTA